MIDDFDIQVCPEEKEEDYFQCGDCLMNMGDNGSGCYCERDGHLINICNSACKYFILFEG